MSRVGKKPILLPAGVEVMIDGTHVTVKGPKGTLTRNVHASMLPKIGEEGNGKALVVEVNGDTHELSPLWGTTRALLGNMVTGVSTGYTKSLELIGVGFKAALMGKKIQLSLGFSHDVDVPIPEGLTVTVEKGIITVTGADKEQVGQFTAYLRSLKKPEPYKGKGMKYTDEVIRRKAGKAAKSAE
ncbi:50S ribosomal protein L6 [Candidatus Uhrbacteria bacterium]|nr:50S ribosomal protein L6 [Candidatus Uhrbacteria bacterium]